MRNRDAIELRISKEILPELPSNFKTSRLGEKRGSIRQFRLDGSRIHVREYDYNFTVHVDKVDPKTNPLLHLAIDSPQTLGALAGSVIIGSSVRKFEHSTLVNKDNNAHIPNAFSGGLGILTSLFSFFILNKLLRSFKNLLLIF